MTHHGSNAHGVVADHRADAAWLGSASRRARRVRHFCAPLQTTPEILCRSPSVSAQDENSQPWRLEAANVQPVVQPAMTVLIHAVAAHHAIMAGPPRERRIWCLV